MMKILFNDNKRFTHKFHYTIRVTIYFARASFFSGIITQMLMMQNILCLLALLTFCTGSLSRADHKVTGNYEFLGRYHPSHHVGAIDQVYSALTTAFWDSTRPSQSIQSVFPAFKVVLPSEGEDLKRSKMLVGIKKDWEGILDSISTDEIFAQCASRDEQSAKLIYETISCNLFANLSEFEKPTPDQVDTHDDYTDVVEPLLCFVVELPNVHPADSLLVRHFASSEFIIQMSNLLHSPIWPERKSVTLFYQNVLNIFSSNNEVVKAILQQAGLALYDARIGTKKVLRPLDQVFEIITHAAVYSSEECLCQFTINYIYPFINSSLIISYGSTISNLLKTIFKRLKGSSSHVKKLQESLECIKFVSRDQSVEKARIEILIALLQGDFTTVGNLKTSLLTLFRCATISKHEPTREAILDYLLVGYAIIFLNHIEVTYTLIENVANWILESDAIEGQGKLIMLWKRLKSDCIPLLNPDPPVWALIQEVETKLGSQ